MNDTITHTREDVHAAFNRAYGEAENIAGVDQALDIMSRLELSAYLPDGTGDVTRQAALNAYNAMAEAAKEEYNPDESEDDKRSVRSDSVGDLMVHLAHGFLIDDEADADDIIADAWRDLNLHDFAAYAQWRETYEGAPIDAARTYEQDRREAIVAEVKSWF